MTINAEIWLINSVKTCHELFIELKARLSLFVFLWYSQIQISGQVQNCILYTDAVYYNFLYDIC